MVGERIARVARVAVIGDVHAEDELLERALSALSRRHLDALLCVGDVADGPGDVDRCFDLLAEHQVLTVSGNHERWFLTNEMRGLPAATTQVKPATRERMEALPKTRRFETPAGTMLLCHGIGEDDMADLRPTTKGYSLQDIPTLRELMLDPTVDYVIGGHTHVRMARRFQGLCVLNAGAIARDVEPVVMLVDFEGAA